MALPISCPRFPGDLAAREGFYVPSPNRFASFAWLDTVLGFVQLRSNGPDLELKPLQSPAVTLQPAGAHLFKAAERVTASHALLTSVDGKRTISTGMQTYHQVSLLMLLPLWTSLIASVQGCVHILRPVRCHGHARGTARRRRAGGMGIAALAAVGQDFRPGRG